MTTLCPICGTERHYGNRGAPCDYCRHARAMSLKSIRTPAHNAVASAIKRGALPRLDGSTACKDCGGPAKVYDHREYGKPLEVDPVCIRCNNLRGPAKDIAHLIVRNVGHFTATPRMSMASASRHKRELRHK